MADATPEPSMEEILASIKRIIAEDDEPAVLAQSRRTRPVRTPPAVEGGFTPDAQAAEPADPDVEVLELTEQVGEPRAADQPVATGWSEEAALNDQDAQATAPEQGPATANPATIVSQDAAAASRTALAALSALIVKPEQPAAENTLEALVREMLRPMLKEWLDARLPTLVEELVSKEIARITGRG